MGAPAEIVRSARREDLSDLLSLYQELNPADPRLDDDAALRAFDAMLVHPACMSS